MLVSGMRLLEQCLSTIVQQVTPRLPATLSHALSLIEEIYLKKVLCS